ncbi:MAG: DUF2782 domain-containing protein [Burkholderiaceae bacterium]
MKNIMRTLKFASIFTVCAIAWIAPFSVSAQQSQPKNQDAPPPPKMEKLEEGEPPTVNIHEPKNKQTITEKRSPDGQVKEVKVTKGKNTYTVKPNVRPGSALPGDGQSPQSRPAQWQVYEFNNKKKPKESEIEDAPPPAVAPPAPTKK